MRRYTPLIVGAAIALLMVTLTLVTTPGRAQEQPIQATPFSRTVFTNGSLAAWQNYLGIGSSNALSGTILTNYIVASVGQANTNSTNFTVTTSNSLYAALSGGSSLNGTVLTNYIIAASNGAVATAATQTAALGANVTNNFLGGISLGAGSSGLLLTTNVSAGRTNVQLTASSGSGGIPTLSGAGTNTTLAGPVILTNEFLPSNGIVQYYGPGEYYFETNFAVSSGVAGIPVWSNVWFETFPGTYSMHLDVAAHEVLTSSTGRPVNRYVGDGEIWGTSGAAVSVGTFSFSRAFDLQGVYRLHFGQDSSGSTGLDIDLSPYSGFTVFLSAKIRISRSSDSGTGIAYATP